MESAVEVPAIAEGVGVIADQSNVIYLVEEEDIKPDISDRSCQGVDHDPLVQGMDQDELFSHNTDCNDFKNEFSDEDIIIKHENIDYDNRIEPHSEMNLINLGKRINKDLINLKKYGETNNKELRINCHEKEVTLQKSEKPFKCSYCDRAFSQSSYRNSHHRDHNGEKPFKCSYCDKAFSRPSDLNRHQRIHTGEKPFKCSHCDEAFYRISFLNKHIRIHSGVRPIKCSYCDKAFSQSSAFNRHQRIHTSEKLLN